jgi:hypothetical protein
VFVEAINRASASVRARAKDKEGMKGCGKCPFHRRLPKLAAGKNSKYRLKSMAWLYKWERK